MSSFIRISATTAVFLAASISASAQPATASVNDDCTLKYDECIAAGNSQFVCGREFVKCQYGWARSSRQANIPARRQH